MEHDNEYFYELMSASLDNELTPVQQQELDEFLASNPNMQAEFDELSQAGSLMGDFFKNAQSTMENVSVWDSISDQLPKIDTPSSRIVVPFYKRRATWISSALAASVLIFFGFYLFIFSNTQYNEPNNTCIVESVESESSSVMVFKDTNTNTTIIWMFSSAPSEGRTTS